MHAFVDRPKVVLHDHLDGGVRPSTLIELAETADVDLPVRDATELMDWFTVRPEMTIAEAFTRFDVVTSVLQSEAALRRVAREAAEDLHADGVIHAEIRLAPLLHCRGGLDGDAVIDAVLAGLAEAEAPGTSTALIVCALRNLDPEQSVAAATVAVGAAGRGVVGFDLAGPEPGFPADAHVAAFAMARQSGLGLTVHAGEMDGVASVASALALAPHRIGHGWRLIDDCEVVDGRVVAVGSTASRVRDAAIPLEVCLTSNACLGQPVERHPAKQLVDVGFRVTLNPDNRSITTTSTSREHDLAARVLGFTNLDLAAANERAAVSAFVDDAARSDLIARVRAGWRPRAPRLVHLAERSVWEAADAVHAYLPLSFGDDGFIHLSAPHQVLSPANALYRGREDVVALVLDAHLLGDAVVWEDGTGTVEQFPHLYGAITPDAVLAAIELKPGADGSFVLPEPLVDAVT